MLDEAVLDLGRADAIAGDLEHVVGAALVPEIAVVVARRDVAGAAPVAGVLLRACPRDCRSTRGRTPGRACRPARCGARRRRRARRAGSSLPSSSITAIAVARIRASHRARLRRPQRVRVADDVVHLGLAEHLVDRDAERVARPFEHRRADRFAGAHDRCAGSTSNALARPRIRLHHQLERGREQERVADLVLLDQPERALRVEAAAVADDRLAEIQRRQQRVHQAAGPRPVRGRPEQIALAAESRRASG